MLKRNITESTKTVNDKENENDDQPIKKSKIIETPDEKDLEPPKEPSNFRLENKCNY